MSGHTPGPWDTDCAEHDCPYQDLKILAGTRSICTVWIDDAPVHDFNAEQEANARVIVAAPTMLTAIEHFEAWWQEVGQVSFNGAPACVFALREAAAKARGGV